MKMIANPFPCPIIPGIAELFETPLPKISLPKESEPEVYLYRDLFLKEYKRNEGKGVVRETQKNDNRNSKKGVAKKQNNEKKKPEKQKRKKTKKKNTDAIPCNIDSDFEDDDPTLALPERVSSSTHKWPSKHIEVMKNVPKLNKDKPSQPVQTRIDIHTQLQSGYMDANEISKKLITSDPSYDLLGSLLGNNNGQKAVMYESPACMKKDLHQNEDKATDHKKTVEGVKSNSLSKDVKSKKSATGTECLLTKDKESLDHSLNLVDANKLKSGIEKEKRNVSSDENSVNALEKSVLMDSKESLKRQEPVKKNINVVNQLGLNIADCHNDLDSDSDGDFGGELSICIDEESDNESKTNSVSIEKPDKNENIEDKRLTDAVEHTKEVKTTANIKEDLSSDGNVDDSSKKNICSPGDKKIVSSTSDIRNRIDKNKKSIRNAKSTELNFQAPKTISQKTNKGLLHSMKTLKKRTALGVKPMVKKTVSNISIVRTKTVGLNDASNQKEKESNTTITNKACTSAKTDLLVEENEDSLPSSVKRKAHKQKHHQNEKTDNEISSNEVNTYEEEGSIDTLKDCGKEKEILTDKTSLNVKAGGNIGEKPVRKRKLPVKRSLPKKVDEKASSEVADKIYENHIGTSEGSMENKNVEVAEEQTPRKRKLPVKRSLQEKNDKEKLNNSFEKEGINDSETIVKKIKTEKLEGTPARKRKLPVKRSSPKKGDGVVSRQSFDNNERADSKKTSRFDDSVNSVKERDFNRTKSESDYHNQRSDDTFLNRQNESNFESEGRKYPRRANRSHIDHYSDYSNSYESDYRRAINNSRNDFNERQRRDERDYEGEANRSNYQMERGGSSRRDHSNNERRSSDNTQNERRNTRSMSRRNQNEPFQNNWYDSPNNSSDLGNSPRDTTSVKRRHRSVRQIEARKAYMTKRQIDMQRARERQAYEKTLPCGFYKKHGKCDFGDECRYSHDIDVDVKYECCRYYVSGACNKGDECDRFHEEWPCKFFHTTGRCHQKDNCRFSHDPITHPKLKEAFEARLQEEEAQNAERLAAEEAESRLRTQTSQGNTLRYNSLAGPSSPSPIKTIPPPSRSIESGNSPTIKTDDDKAKLPSGNTEPSKTIEEFQFPSLYYELT